MTTTVYNPTSDGSVFSLDGVYATFAAGSNQTADTAGTTIHVGQFASGPFQGNEGFWAFDTSGIGTDVVSVATFSMYCVTDSSTTDFTTEVFAFDWSAGGLTTADWRNPTQLGAFTLLASHASVGVSVNLHNGFTSTAAFLTAINTTGTTYLMAMSDRFRLGTQPPDSEEIVWASNDDATSSHRPTLTVTYAPAPPAVLGRRPVNRRF